MVMTSQFRTAGADQAYRTRLVPLARSWARSGARVAIFGTGAHTEYLLEAVPELARTGLVAFLESDAADDERTFRGLPVRPPSWAAGHCDVVLCSSFAHELAQMAVFDGVPLKVIPSHLGVTTLAPTAAGNPSGDDPFLTFLQAADQTEYLQAHRRRYIDSLKWLRPVIAPGMSVLEVGGRSVVLDFLEQTWGVAASATDGDLRYPFGLPDDSVDLVLNMEVLEHLKDRDEDNRDYWGRTMRTWSGVTSCLAECRRVLRPGGRLFCTTPNAAGTLAIERILRHEPPMVYAPHVREMTVTELRRRLDAAGFEVDRIETVWSWHAPADVTAVLATLDLAGASAADRGDNIFCLATRRHGQPACGNAAP